MYSNLKQSTFSLPSFLRNLRKFIIFMQPNYQRFLFQNLSPERQDEILLKTASQRRQRELLEEQIREKQQRKQLEETQNQSRRMRVPQEMSYVQPQQFSITNQSFSSTLPPIVLKQNFSLKPRGITLAQRDNISALQKAKMNLTLSPKSIHNCFSTLRNNMRNSAPISRLTSPRKNETF